MPAQFLGQYGFGPQRLSSMLQGLEAEESERKRMAAQLSIERARQKAQSAQLKLQEEQFEWTKEEADKARTFEAQQAEQEQLSTLLGQQMEQQTEMAELYAPDFMQVGNAVIRTNRATGEATEVAYIPEGVVLEYGQRLVEKSSGEVMTESEDIMQDQFHIYGIRGGEIVSRGRKFDIPEGFVGKYTPEGAVDVFNLDTGEFKERILTTEPAKATMAQMIEAEAKKQEVEYDYVVGMADIRAAKEMNWATLDSNERIEAAREVGKDLDRALDEDMVTIEKGKLVLDRDKMIQKARTDEERDQVDKYIADLQAKTTENVEQLRLTLGYAELDTATFIERIKAASKEKVAWWEIKSDVDIATLDRAVALKAVQVTAKGLEVKMAVATLLEMGLNERAELGRNLTAELAANTYKLGELDFAVRMRAVDVTEEKIRVTAQTARLLDLSETERANLDRRLTAQVEAEKIKAEYAGLTTKEVIARIEEKVEMAKLGAKQAGEAKEHTDHVMAMMARATGQVKPTYGDLSPNDRARAAGIFIELLNADQYLPLDVKARYVQIAPGLQGITQAEMIDPQLAGAYDWMRSLWNEAITSANEAAGLPPPSSVHKGVSLDAITEEVDRIYAETGSNRKVKAYLKKYDLTLERYAELVREARRVVVE